MFIRLTLGLAIGIFAGMTIYGTDQPVGAAIASVETGQIEGDSTGLMDVITAEPADKVATDAPTVKSTLVTKTVTLTPVALTPTAPKVELQKGLIQLGTSDAPIKAAMKAGIDMVEVTGSAVNMRAGPSTSAKVLARLGRGVRAELVSETPDGWMEIRDPGTGAVGFMSADFLTSVTPG